MYTRAMNYVLGVLGGSGLYEMEGLANVREERVTTPWGDPSDAVVRGKLGDVELLFLPRHGRGHLVAPSAINYRANVAALKRLGATHVVAVSAVGSMKEAIEPGHLVVVDQFIDLTRKRATTFFSQAPVGSADASAEIGAPVAHVPLAEPIDRDLAHALADSAQTIGAVVHRGGTYVCIEGPQFSTRAESLLYRSWGVDVIGMTNATEAKLAREACLPFATLALATDYDCWHDAHESVTVDQVVATMKANVQKARAAIAEVSRRLFDPSKSPAARAMNGAVMTDSKKIAEAVREKYRLLIG
jgi:5'-methylthioadenosine phosphorylase